ncbi:MAG: ABC transporter substrate-binding protein [Deltaproteobacteria bacterium]|nr:ABC transporter substrate-binding protein [Candidatus Anaeroferrophillacea bacterium]
MIGLLLVFVNACSGPPEPIIIGLAVNLSGIGGEAGEHIRDGALLAVDDVNRRGGIAGRPLRLLVRDDENRSEIIQRVDGELVDAGVVAVIGHSYSANTLKAYPLVTGRRTLLLTAYTAAAALSGRDDLFVRTSVDCVQYGRSTAVLLQARGVQSLVCLMDMSNADFVNDYERQVAASFAGEIRMVPFDSTAPVDWQALVEALIESSPDAVLLLTEASMTGVALQKLQLAGYCGLRLATVWAQAPGLLRYAAAAAEGLAIITFIDPENSRPDFLSFARRMEEQFNRPASARSARAYELVTILADALRRCDSFDSVALKRALLARSYDTILGRVAFDACGDVIRPLYEVVVRGGAMRTQGVIGP